MDGTVGDKFLYEDEPLVFHLIRAENHLGQAMKLVYGTYDTMPFYKRGLFWRMALGRAQSITMKLLVRELAKVSTVHHEVEES